MKDFVKLVGSSNNEITEVQPSDAHGKKVVRRSFAHIRIGVGALEGFQLIGRNKEMNNIIELILNKDRQHCEVTSVWGDGWSWKNHTSRRCLSKPRVE